MHAWFWSVGLDVTLLLITDTQRPGKPRSANERYIKTVFPTIIDLGKICLILHNWLKTQDVVYCVKTEK